MISLLSIAIGIGLAVSLVFSELFGLAAGGMVVPGYFAIHFDRPSDIAATLGAAVVTYLVVHLFSTFVIVYGKRRTVLMILVSYLIRMMVDAVPYDFVRAIDVAGGAEFEVVGYIIPGLIAIWIDRQGLVETISTLLTAAVMVRLVLILIYGAGLWL